MRNTMTGDHWAVLRPLMDATEVPAEQTEDSPTPGADVPAQQSEYSPTPITEVPAEQSGDSRAEVDEESHPMCPVSPTPMSPRLLTNLKNGICHGTGADACPMNPRMLASPHTKSALDFNALLVRMGSIQFEYGTDTGSSAESGATSG